MIRYTLSCSNDHRFESWFAGAEAYDTLHAAGQVACPVCGATQVEKSLMAPRVTTGKAAQARLSEPGSDMEKAMQKMRRQVEENSEYVGLSFAREARAIHEGDAPERSIYGEARADEARKLLEDGVPVAPLPFMPKAKTN